MLELLKAFLFGIVEGITEWLPISSTGHMILLNEFIKLDVSEEFYELFEVVIQLGAILAVVLLYFKKIWPWGFNKTKEETQNTFKLWGLMLIGCIPAGVLGIMFDDFLEEKLHGAVVVAITLILYGIIFIIMESVNLGKKTTKNLKDITIKQSFMVGLFQVLSLIPGTSRSGSTILGGLTVGLDRKTIADFTFILAIPVMAGASLIKLLKYIKDVGFNFTGLELGVLGIGTLTAFIVSLFVIRFFIKYIRKHDFKVFGYYRIVLGIIVLLYFLILK